MEWILFLVWLFTPPIIAKGPFASPVINMVYSRQILSRRDNILKTLVGIAPKYYEAIGARGVPSGFSQCLRQGASLFYNPRFAVVLIKSVPEIIEVISTRLSSELRRPSNVLFGPFHILIQLFRVTPESGKWSSPTETAGARMALHDLMMSIPVHTRTETASNYFLWFLGIGDYIKELNGDVYSNKEDGAVDFLEQYWIPRFVRDPGDGLVRTWGDDQDSYYPQNLREIEDFISIGRTEERWTARTIGAVGDFFNLVRSSSGYIGNAFNKASKERLKASLKKVLEALILE